MRDLIEKLALLSEDVRLMEAAVQPGEKKEISFQLKKLDNLYSELTDYQRSMYQLKNTKLPPAMQAKMATLQQELEAEISKVQKAYDDVREKSTVDDKPIKMNNMFAGLQKNCKQIIKVYKELNNENFTKQVFLYRGIRSRSDAVYGKPFDNRKPKDSSSELDATLNASMERMGLEARRNNSMFVTGNRSQASGYGYDLYVMFPVDGFKYAWSKTTADLILDNSKRMELLDKDAVQAVRDAIAEAGEKNPEVKQRFPNPSSMFTYGYEITGEINQVKVAVEDKLLPEKVADMVSNLITDSSIQEYFKFTDKDLFQAITSRNEVYLRGAYYAVNTKHMAELVDFLKKVDVDSVELPESFGEPPEVFDAGDVVVITDGPNKDKVGTITYVGSTAYDVYFSTGSYATFSPGQLQSYKLPDGSLPTFSEGDEIQVTNPDSSYYGKIGNIQYAWQDSGKFEIKFQNGDRRDLYKSEIQKYDPTNALPIPDEQEKKSFKINDKIVVIDKDSQYYAKTGTITWIGPSGNVEVTINDGPSHLVLKQEQIKIDPLSTSDTDFAVGDTVQINAGDFTGYYGTITDVINSPSGGAADVELAGMDKTIVVATSKLDHYPTKKTNTDGKFSIGDAVKITDTTSIYHGRQGTITDGPDGDGDYVVKFSGSGWSYFKSTQMIKTENKTPDEPETEQFKVGESVKIKSGDYAGKIGVVSYVYSSYPEVSVKFNHGTEKDFKLTEVEKVFADYKPGTKVKIIADDIFNGKTGVIISGPDSDGEFDVDIDDSPGSEYYTPDKLEKIEEPETPAKKEFSVGDSVKITGGSYLHNFGKIGKVKNTFPNQGTVMVEFTDGLTVTYLADELEKTETEAEAPDAIKVGDTIKVIEKDSSYYGKQGKVIEKGFSSAGQEWLKIEPGEWKTFTSFVEKIASAESDTVTQDIDLTGMDPDDAVKLLQVGQTVFITGGKWKGQTGKIEHVYETYGDAEVKFDDGQSDQDVPANVMKIIGGKLDPDKLYPGDKAKVIEKDSSYLGKVGTIKSGPDSDNDYIVEFNDEDWEYLNKYQLEKITPSSASTQSKDEIDNLTWEPEPEAKAPIKVGDTVKNVKNLHPHYGKTAEVKTVYSSGNVLLLYSDGSQAIDPAEWLEKVAAATPTLAVGDKVEVVGQFPSLIGLTGIVTQAASPPYDFVSVKLDGNTAASSFPVSALQKINSSATISNQELKIGDHVEVTKSGTFLGKTGKIESFPPGNWITIISDDTDSLISGLKKDDVILIPPESTQEFHLGDRVEIINPDLSSFGQKGKITDMDLHMIIVQTDDGDVKFIKKSSAKKID